MALSVSKQTKNPVIPAVDFALDLPAMFCFYLEIKELRDEHIGPFEQWIQTPEAHKLMEELCVNS